MIAYNITTKVDWAILTDWLIWVEREHIPEIMDTKLFDQHKIYRLLDQDDQEGPTFTIQYFTSSKERYREYMDSFAFLFQERANNKWKNQFITHHSAMELVN
jgi:Domain of unknown function (DUF4286)